MPPHTRARLRMDMIQYKEMGYHDMKMNRLAAAMCAALMLTAAVPFVTMMQETATISVHAEELTEGDYTYRFYGEDQVFILKYNGNDTVVTIPDTINSTPVTEIDGAFKDCTSITTVTIPEGVKTIGSDAFLRCTSLTDVTIPAGVKNIGYHAFEGCTSLKTVTIPEGLSNICLFAFSGCTDLTSVRLPKSSYTSIGGNAFEKCPNLTFTVYKDSAWQRFAEDFMIPYVFYGEEEISALALGDANSDGSIDANDASDILVASTEQAVGHEIPLTEAQQKAADVNKDGHFDAIDASYILIYSTRKGTGQDATFEELVAEDA